jgi:ribulose-5-phosphate 4-epimerase/fuculose-1-phosphate aldolase
MHPPHATALATLEDPTIHPIDQVTARFYKRMAYDLSFGGIATEGKEGERISRTVGNHRSVMMQNHGVTTLGATVAEAWDALYHLERAAKTLVLAYSTGQPLKVMPDDLAEETAAEWEAYRDAEFAHFNEMKRVLDKEEPDYKD